MFGNSTSMRDVDRKPQTSHTHVGAHISKDVRHLWSNVLLAQVGCFSLFLNVFISYSMLFFQDFEVSRFSLTN